VSVQDEQRTVPDVVRTTRPLFARPAYLGLVLAGGAIGTAVRSALETRFGAAPGQWPWPTFTINVSGALLLGLLLTTLNRTGPDEGWRRNSRLLLGTGVMGGYTTYSSFVVEADQLVDVGRPGLALAYATLSILLGTAGALAGVLVGRRVTRRLHPAGAS